MATLQNNNWHLLQFAGRPARGELLLPGGKSRAIRAIFLAAQAAGTSEIGPVVRAEDVERALGWVESAGAGVERELRDGNLFVKITGIGGPPRFDGQTLDAGDSAAVLRFGLAWCAAGRGIVKITGSEQLARRPHGEGLEFYRKAGARIESAGGTFPFLLQACGMDILQMEMRAESTSQFASGLLLAAPLVSAAAGAPFTLRIPNNAPSGDYLLQTLEILQMFGVCATLQIDTATGDSIFTVSGPCRATRAAVAADASHELLFASVAAVLGGKVKINYPAGTGSPSARHSQSASFLESYLSAGLAIARGEGFIQFEGRCEGAIHADCSRDPDAAPPLAITALFAREPSHLRCVERLRIKESDRLEGLQRAIAALGGRSRVDANTTIPGALDLEIEPAAVPRAARLSVQNDHRLAMAFSLAGLAIPGVEIDDPACVAKSMADFFDRLAAAVGR